VAGKSARQTATTRAALTDAVVRHRWWWIVGTTTVVAVALFATLWPSAAPRSLPPPRARQYSAFDACLLTGSQGLADPNARPVWAGMQDASATTRSKVSYLAVTGPQTTGNAVPYVNTLLQRKCSLVVAIGQSQVDALGQVAPAHPNTHFAVMGDKSVINNVTAIPGNPVGAVRSSIATLIEHLVH
jgi:basic membrane lipoprotein Med (substrate-binding protein (PBP1-ABC) superfamily)